MKLSLDEQEALLSLMELQGWNTLIKVLEGTAEEMGRDILRLDLTLSSKDSNKDELIQKKLLHQGALALVARFKQRLTKHSQPSSDVITGVPHVRRIQTRSRKTSSR